MLDICDFFWTSLIANVGGKPSNSVMDKKFSYEIIVFLSLLCGTFVWIFYRGEMNAVLSVRSKMEPFTDLDSFEKTDWR